METLTPEYFEQWWNIHIHPEDQEEFVHGPWQGTMDHARFVCAYHHLSLTAAPNDLVTRAYTLSENIDPMNTRLQYVRDSAQGMFAEAAVQFLLDRLQYRNSRAQEAQVGERVLQKIEELARRTETVQGGANDGGTRFPFDSYQDRLSTERVLLDAGVRFLSGRAKVRADELKRSERKELRDSISRGKRELKNVTQEPSKDEIKQFILMAKQMLSVEEFKELVGQPALEDSHGQTNES